MDFFDRTLLTLKRHYSKDEVVAVLIKKLSEKEIEVGKLSAEVDYLQSKLQSNLDQKEINRAGKKMARKDELYKLKVEESINQIKEIKKLKQTRDALIAKCYALEKKCAEANN